MKNKQDRKVNRLVKSMNKMLCDDVFGDRFYFQQKRKTIQDGERYYLYELQDRADPTRNTLMDWVWGDSTFLAADFWDAANDFIVKSNFWAEYFSDPTRYNPQIDSYKKNY